MKRLLAVFNGTKTEFDSLEEIGYLDQFMEAAAAMRNQYENNH